jgi:hypothetical protein
MNEMLMAPFTEEEVRKAMFAIGDFKAPGVDGMHAIFFKKNLADYWRCNHKRSTGVLGNRCYTAWME